MKLPTKYFPLIWLAVIAVVLWLLWGVDVIHASDDYRNDDDTTAEANASADAESQSTADAAAESSAIGEGGAGGMSTVTTRNESTSLVLTGARDTAPCFTKVTIGAEGFGIGFSRGDPYCKKVRRVAAHLVLENWNAAARLECTLKVWREVYGRDANACFDDLFAGPDQTPAAPELTGLYNQAAQDNDYFFAQVAQDEFDDAKEQAELVERRVSQQQNKIETLEQNEAELRAEVERLRDEAAAKAAADEARRIALGEALQNYKVVKEL
jgi:hypothetical protein